jgi:hypothetical protein
MIIGSGAAGGRNFIERPKTYVIIITSFFMGNRPSNQFMCERFLNVRRSLEMDAKSDKEAPAEYGKPAIFSTERSRQFASNSFTPTPEDVGIKGAT